MRNSSQTGSKNKLEKLRIKRTITKVKSPKNTNDDPLQTLPTWTWLFR